MKLWLLFIFLVPFFSYADPWGKDADLVQQKCHAPCVNPSSSWLAKIGKKAIRFHQVVISPADGPRSHFIPSSSQYTLEAMQRHGFFKGWIMGCDRLMRENEDPWVYQTIKDPSGKLIKWDPVK